MGITYSQNNYTDIKDVDTLCFNMVTIENNILDIFYKIISKINKLYNVDVDTNIIKNIEKSDKILHVHFEINNVLFEIKLAKEEKLYSLGLVQIKLKIFTQKKDKINKAIFNKLCSSCVKSFASFSHEVDSN